MPEAIQGSAKTPLRVQAGQWPTVFQPRNGMFSPGEPLVPPDPQPVRSFDFIPGQNTIYRPRAYEGFGFPELRAFANVELVRLAIETRKDQVERLEWQVKPKDGRKARKDAEERIRKIERFFAKPDGRNGFHTWLRLLIEDLLVLDAPALEKRRTRAGDLIGLEIVPGDTVHILIDSNGRRPAAPAPAYQQVIRGRVWCNLTEDELFYLPRNPRSGKLYGMGPVEQTIVTINTVMRRQASQLAYFCYSDDTEVLTKRGWLRFAETVESDEFATRKMEAGEFEWQRAFKWVRKPYKGELVHFSGKRLDVLVTPNHRMLVAGNAGSKYQREYVTTAEDLEEYGSPANTAFVLTSNWRGTPIKEVKFESEDMRCKPVVMSGDDYCAFMGMYLAEGSTRRSSISIAQPKDDERGARDVFEALLLKIFNGGVYSGERNLEVGRRVLVDHLKQFGHAHEKFVPHIIRDATPRQLRIFWEHYYLGDGRAIKAQERRGKAYLGTPQCTTVSRKLADHLCEIGQKLGFAPVVWTNPARKAIAFGRELNCRENYVISFSRKPLTKHWDVERVPYDGEVFCVSVPATFLYVRRNGKACWCGNTEGNVPAGLCSVPDTWTVDQVKNWQDWMDAALSGNLAERRKLLWAPAGTQYQAFKESPLKDDTDEWFARIICYAFSLPPTPFIKQMNRSTGQQDYERALEEGLAPLLVWVKRLCDTIIHEEFGFRDLEFSWNNEKDIDPEVQAGIDDKALRNGSVTLDEVRDRSGLDPYPGGIGAQPLIYTKNGAVPLERVFDEPEPEPANSDGGNAPPDDGTDDNGTPAKKIATIIAELQRLAPALAA